MSALDPGNSLSRVSGRLAPVSSGDQDQRRVFPAAAGEPLAVGRPGERTPREERRRYTDSASLCVRVLRCAGRTKTVPGCSARPRRNAIDRPSGDQAGLLSSAASVVSLSGGPDPAASHRCRSCPASRRSTRTRRDRPPATGWAASRRPVRGDWHGRRSLGSGAGSARDDRHPATPTTTTAAMASDATMSQRVCRGREKLSGPLQVLSDQLNGLVALLTILHQASRDDALERSRRG